jgi:hypothetical protein
MGYQANGFLAGINGQIGIVHIQTYKEFNEYQKHELAIGST